MPDKRALTLQSCRHCGAGAPTEAHFCPHCDRILSLTRHGDYFSFFGLPRKLGLDLDDLERRFRTLSRQFHPDYYYNASTTERLASLERSSYLNDAYRVLKEPLDRAEYLLEIEGLPAGKRQDSGAMAPALLEEVFTLNEELDEIRAARAAGAAPAELRDRVEHARGPIDARAADEQRRLEDLAARWDGQVDAGAPASERRATLEALRSLLQERSYIANLLAAVNAESEQVQ
jgi:molecular chaperone HscB